MVIAIHNAVELITNLPSLKNAEILSKIMYNVNSRIKIYREIEINE